LNIKPCMGHISGTWELLLCEYWRKSMIIGEKNTDLKRLTGRLKLCFLTEIGWLHWNQGKEVAHFAWFGEPCTCIYLLEVSILSLFLRLSDWILELFWPCCTFCFSIYFSYIVTTRLNGAGKKRLENSNKLTGVPPTPNAWYYYYAK
jgi:hypothetical protein